MALIIFLYATWTSVFAIGKMTVAYTSPLFLTSTRMILAGFLLTSFIFFKKNISLKVSKKQLFAILLLAVLTMYLTNVLELWGLQYLSTAKTCFIYSLTPFFAAFFSYLHFKEKMTKKKWLGMCIGFLGIVPAIYFQSGSSSISGKATIFSMPEISILLATMFSVYGWILLRLLVKNSSFSPLVANGISMLIGGFLALIHSYFIDTWAPLPINTGYVGNFIRGTLLMTFVSNIVCYNLYGYLLKKYTATFLSFFGLLSPILASFTGWVFLGERPSLIIMGSTIVIGCGLWIVYKEELKQGYIKQKVKVKID